MASDPATESTFPLILRLLIPTAWIWLPVSSINPLYWSLLLIFFAVFSFYLQPLTMTMVIAVVSGWLTYSYLNRTPAKIAPLDAKVSGKEDGEMLFFIHGWPDTGDLWRRNVPVLAKKYRTVTITWPAFQGRASKLNSWGYSFDEMLECCMLTIKRELEAAGKKQCVIVGHDWGAYLTELLVTKYPDMFKASVIIDVFLGAYKIPRISSVAMFGVCYQYLLIFVFLLDGFPLVGSSIADYMLYGWLKAIKRPTYPYGSRPDAASCYPYFYFHLDAWQVALGLKKSFLDRHGLEVPSMHPRMKTLFCLAIDKSLMFHNKKMARKLEERKDGSKVENFGDKSKPDKIGHWLHFNDAEKFNETIDSWVETNVIGDQKAQ
ncbi:hypothetical protein AAMO2058_001014100 [Amorphochlora amoebiformis]